MVSRVWCWVRGFTRERQEENFLSQGNILHFDFYDIIGAFKFQIWPFWNLYKLLLFEIVAGYTMHMAPIYSDPQLIKGKILQYWKGLTVSIKSSHVLVQQCFWVYSKNTKTLSITGCNLEILSIRKYIPRRNLFNLTGEDPISYY